jgi:hypothetical protein
MLVNSWNTRVDGSEPTTKEDVMAEKEQGIERGAAEDAAGVPVTPTDVDASRKPPSQPDESVTQDDGAGMAGGSSGGSGGGSTMPGHPDAS